MLRFNCSLFLFEFRLVFTWPFSIRPSGHRGNFVFASCIWGHFFCFDKVCDVACKWLRSRSERPAHPVFRLGSLVVVLSHCSHLAKHVKFSLLIMKGLTLLDFLYYFFVDCKSDQLRLSRDFSDIFIVFVSLLIAFGFRFLLISFKHLHKIMTLFMFPYFFYGEVVLLARLIYWYCAY